MTEAEKIEELEHALHLWQQARRVTKESDGRLLAIDYTTCGKRLFALDKAISELERGNPSPLAEAALLRAHRAMMGSTLLEGEMQ